MRHIANSGLSKTGPLALSNRPFPAKIDSKWSFSRFGLH